MTTILHENMESKYLKDKLHNASYSFYEKETSRVEWWVAFIISIFFKIRHKAEPRLAFEVCFGVGCVVGTVSV